MVAPQPRLSWTQPTKTDTAKLEMAEEKLVTDSTVWLFQSVVRNWLMPGCGVSSPPQ